MILNFSTIMISPSPSPSTSPSPAAPPITGTFLTDQHSSSSSSSLSPPSSVYSGKSAVNFSPPLIAMVAVVATAFLMVSYSRVLSRHLIRLHRRIRFRHHHLPTSSSASFSSSSSCPPFLDSPPSDTFHVYSPYGLDDHVIKTIPLSLFTRSSLASSAKDCAVCLLDFEDERDYVRTLPNCSHSFHVECIDMWLRSHATCPLCRAGIFVESPFTPLMASRIRWSLDDDVILNDPIIFEGANYPNPNSNSSRSNVTTSEIVEEEMQLEPQSRRSSDFVLKRSYSFGFEKGGASERMAVVEEAVTASPWRWRRGREGGWKRMSPFGMIGKGSSANRVFSFRYNHYSNYRKSSPIMFRHRGGLGFFPQSESRFFGGGRKGKFGGSPMMVVGGSRMRCGDPEALLSPDRFNNSSRR